MLHDSAWFRRHLLLLSLVACGPSGSVSVVPDAAAPDAAAPDAPAHAVAEPPAAADSAAQFDVLARQAVAAFDVPGLAVAVVVGDEVVFAQGYGEIERGRGQPVTAETSFAIASNTKAFTATAIGMLVADGQLSWDDRVVDHLPELELWDPYVTRELRVRDLLSHRVGLATWAGDLMWLSSNFNRQQVLARLKHLEPQSSFRAGYGYCNLMYIVAGELIERKSGQTWDGFIRQRILDPLGMQRVSTRKGQLDGKPNVAKPHILVDGQWNTTPYLDLRTLGAAGAFHADVLDMSRWVRMQLADGVFEGETIVPRAAIAETRQPHIPLRVPEDDLFQPSRTLAAYGLGWYLGDYRGELMVTHSGGMPGMISRVLMFPDADVGIVVLTSSESGASLALALAIADDLLAPGEVEHHDYIATMAERAKQVPHEDVADLSSALSGEGPAELAGTWSNPLLGAATIADDGGHFYFVATEHGGLRCRLYATTSAGDSDVPCAWDDPNMKVSSFRVERDGKRVHSISFRVRPDFYDPLEYTFTRANKKRGSKASK